ncbi:MULTISPECIES: L-serine ammonia-lyase [Bradyrhizobium]|uniref:L-serine ammonia-lyase n=1 Tax=Bradyrhizobium centrosematis TaxID=1300039 RepID=UPI002167870C|nr:L-serine ammonia-lyase [Bradyrhizobium centrosematis]MCS3765844.1 L-serine dehydratase [Bradyrhizobium centrosematis]MCS3778275.1 L-serine dehydratase [Bradyrhizobium centrosematis]
MIGIFELFKVGIGPSSSHTVGPMKAAAHFVQRVGLAGLLSRVARVRVDLYGSLAWTGKGHGTDKAVILGLAGELPETVDPDEADRIVATARSERTLRLGGSHSIAFELESDVVFDGVTPAVHHPNTLALTVVNADRQPLHHERWCSIGGGFVVLEDDIGKPLGHSEDEVPYPFRSGRDLLAMAASARISIADMVMANELSRLPREEVEAKLDQIIQVMMSCIDRGMATDGNLPGGLEVRRRAPSLHRRLREASSSNNRAQHAMMDWVSLYAIAVNEENAAGSRVVTAPTNGAAGIIPATLRYFRDHCDEADPDGLRRFLLTASAIGALFKMNASISGAEVGCQGEVGVACSMAAAGLAAVLGGTNEQIENAAEIGMEHHLGMTCDPIGGLVQIPCIERNAFGAIKAISAASLALQGDGKHVVSLDKVIATMRETGRDMQSKYKETSLGGLAVNLAEC